MPLRVIFGCYILVRAERKGISFLGSLPRDSDNLVCAEGLGKQDSKMTKTPSTNNSNTLAWTAFIVAQWCVNCKTSAQQWCCNL